MMIDLDGPKAKVYTEEEGRLIQGNFILLLHTLLFVYLSLHNLLIPVIANLLRDRFLLDDVHFWFLAQIPVQLLLRKKMEIPKGLFFFLVLGSFSRVTYAIATAPALKSWTIVSMLLTEGASFIFYFAYVSQIKLKGNPWPAILGVIAPVVLHNIEVQTPTGPIFLKPKVNIEEHRSVGCEGDKFSLSFPRPHEEASTLLRLVDCGFERRYLRSGKGLLVRNDLPHSVNLRLYRIHVLYGRVSWRFVRLMIVESRKSVDIGTLLKPTEIYLLKSPERSALGVSVIVPQEYSDFPLGNGSLQLTYDTIGWSP